jgi:hypothetical protein
VFFFPLLEITSEAKTKRRLEKTARASKKSSTLRGIKDERVMQNDIRPCFCNLQKRKKKRCKEEHGGKGRFKGLCATKGCTSRKLVVTAFRHKPNGYSFDEVLRIIGLLGSIGVRSLLHTLGVVIISAVTATPSSLERE